MARIAWMFVAALSSVLVACGCGRSSGGQRPEGRLLVERLPAGVEGLELVDGKLRMKAGYEFVSLPNGAFAVVTVPHPPVPPVPTGGCKCSPLGLGVCRSTIVGGIIGCKPNPVCVGSCIATLRLAGTETKVIAF